MKETHIKIIKEKLDRPIVLVGMMGAGKTYLGQQLAKALELPFYDSDDEIEARHQMSIKDIFAKHGQEKFREFEYEVIEGLLSRSPHILSTGGGAVVEDDTQTIMYEKGLMVWLNPSVKTIWEQVKDEIAHRPLIATSANPQKVIEDLLIERSPRYACSDLQTNDETNNVESLLKMTADYLS